MENRLASNARGSGGAVLGVLLIAAGLTFLAVALSPVRVSEDARPLLLIVPGLGLVAIALMRRHLAGLAIPGSMLAVAGLIVAAQQSLGLSSAWSYAWPLVFPGAVGVGVVITGLTRRQPARVMAGLWTVITGLGMCAFFAVFFAGTFGPGGVTIAPVVAIVFPVFLIALGFALLAASVLSSGGQARKPG